jgi:hypothetical protein
MPEDLLALPEPQGKQPSVPDAEAIHTDRRLITLVPEWLQKRLERTPSYVWDLNDVDLASFVKSQHPRIRDCAIQLRLQFWEEFNRCQVNSLKSMNMGNVSEGICGPHYLDFLLASDPQMVAYICTPPPSYLLTMKSMLNLANDRVSEILSVTAASDPKMAKVQVEIWKTLMDRVQGAVVQNVNNRSLNVNVDATPPTDRKAANAMDSLAAIEERLSRVKEKLKRLDAPPQLEVDVKAMVQPDKLKV